MNLKTTKMSVLENKLIAIIIVVNLFSGASYSQKFIPGVVYYDSTGYVEYRAGNLPIIFSAPHDGNLGPSNIPDRDCEGCVSFNDSWTKTITEEIYDEFVKETGCYPHVIINLLQCKILK